MREIYGLIRIEQWTVSLNQKIHPWNLHKPPRIYFKCMGKLTNSQDKS